VTKPTPIIDAAIRAAYDSDAENQAERIRVALRSVCPKEPPSEWVEAMAQAIFIADFCTAHEADFDFGLEKWTARPDNTKKLYRNEALVAYRALPLLRELWGDE
jgi:hypothetical protein